MLAAGERVPVDAIVIEGMSELDVSLVSGESAPLPATPGTVAAGGHAEPDRPADHRRDGHGGEFVPCRDGADDGSGRSRPLDATAVSPTAPRRFTRRWSMSPRF